MVQQEKQFDLIVRLEEQYRDNPEEIGNILVATPGGQQIPLKEFADIHVTTAPRSSTARQLALHRRAVLGRGPRPGRRGGRRHAAGQSVGPLPQGYRVDWGGEYTEYTASRDQLTLILPLTLFLIFLLLFSLYATSSFPSLPWSA